MGQQIAGSVFDDALKTLDQQQPAKPPSTFDQAASVLDNQDKAQQTRLRMSLQQTADTTPDQAAEDRRLAMKFGVPPVVVGRDRETWQKREIADRPYGQMTGESPATAAFVENPDNAKVVHDDLENLGFLEWVLTAPSRAFAQTMNQQKYAGLRYKSMFGDLSQAEHDEMAAAKYHAELGGELGTGDSWFRKALTGTASFLANQAPIVGYAAAGAAEGLAIGGAVGSVTGPGAIPAALGTAAVTGSAGMLYGVLKSTFQQEAAGAYDEYLGFKDELGHKLDPSVARLAAIATGAINAPIEAGAQEFLVRSIPGIDKLSGLAVRSAVKQALRNPTVRGALFEAAKSYVTTLTAETGQEVAQRAITILSGELAKVASGSGLPSRTPGDIARDLEQEGAAAAQSFALALAPGPTLGLAVNARKARSAQANVAFFKTLGEGVAQSKTGQRSPDTLAAFLDSATKNGPIPTVYAPIDTFATYWQSKNIDPAEVAKELTGSSTAYDNAIRTGEDLAIPTAAYAAKLAGTEHNGFFAGELRLGPLEWNARETAAWLEEQKARQGEGPKAPTAVEQMTAQLRGELIQGGHFESTTAEGLSRLVATGIGRLAEDAGLDPVAVLQGYDVNVRRPEVSPAGAAAAAAPRASEIPVDQKIAQAEAVGADAVASTGTSAESTAAGGKQAQPTVQEALAGILDLAGTGNQAGAAVAEQGAAVAQDAGVSTPAGPGSQLRPGTVEQDAARLRQRAEARQRGAIVDNISAAGETLPNAGQQQPAGSATGQQPGGPAGEQLAPDTGGGPQGAGNGGRTESRRLPSITEQIQAEGTEPFQRADKAADKARLTPGVVQELQRIADELNEFPYTGATWSWDVPDKSGNAAGGDANKVAGSAGAPVYDDILDWSPLGTSKTKALVPIDRIEDIKPGESVVWKTLKNGGAQEKGVAVARRKGLVVIQLVGDQKVRVPITEVFREQAKGANKVDAKRDVVEAAVNKVIATGVIHNNIAEGAVRVAERRDAGDYRYINKPLLPPSWGQVASDEMVAELSDAIDTALADADISFNPSEFGQSLFDALDEGLTKPAPDVDTLDTGEQQPRLPGAGAVREANVATPAVADAPFSLTSEASKAKKGKQTELFQGAKPEERVPGEPNAEGHYAVFIGWQPGDERIEVHAQPLYNVFGGPRDRSTLGAAELEKLGIPIPPTPPKPTEYYQGAYHGSPHAFEQFSLHAVGSGEGAQAYGWGLYFASRREVAEGYRDRLSANPVPTFTALTPEENAVLPTWAKWDLAGFADETKRAADTGTAEMVSLEYITVKMRRRFREGAVIHDDMPAIVAALEKLKATGDLSWTKPKGRVYTVAIPEDDVMLDWDRPASKQPPAVQAALRALGVTWEEFKPKTPAQWLHWFDSKVADRLWREDIGIREALHEGYQLASAGHVEAFNRWQEQHQGYGGPGRVDPTGEHIYGELKNQKIVEGNRTADGRPPVEMMPYAKGAELASKVLAGAGVVGLRYLDGGSRNQGSGTHNYVIFDDRLVQITEFDQPFFHGSPHNFDRFSTQHVGTGEGAAAYGWGLYFAENKEVAAGYFDRLSGDPQITRMQVGSMLLTPRNNFDYSRRAGDSNIENIRASLAEDVLIDTMGLLAAGRGGYRDFVLEKLNDKIKDYAEEWPEGLGAAEELRKELLQPGALSIDFNKVEGGVYQVEIPDDQVARMLDWDAPIQKQPAAVKELVRARLKELGYLFAKDNGPRVLTTALRSYVMAEEGMSASPNGETVYSILAKAETQKLNAELLAERNLLDEKYPSAKRANGWSHDDARFSGPTATADFHRWVALTGAIEKNKDKGMELASKALAAVGIPGLKYFDAGSRDVQGQKRTRNVVVFDDSIVKLTHKDGTPVSQQERDEYFQTRNEAQPAPKRRGSIVIGPNRKITINLFADADLSTFIHETGHFFLEVYGDLVDQLGTVPIEQLTDTQRRMMADYGALLQHLGLENRVEIGRDQHEVFAKMFEAYIMEGKAPSAELRSLFARFRSWLLGVYRSLKALDAPLTDDVRRIFDRMLASDKAIAEAEAANKVEAMFSTAAMAGMTEQQFALYRDTVLQASKTAREQLELRLVREVQREREEQWRVRREEIRQQVEKETYDKPVYRALSAIQRGTNPDGSPLIEGLVTPPLKLSRRILVDRFGADRLKSLPRPSIYTVEGGIDPDTVAHKFGFAGGDELLMAIESAGPMRAAVERDTNARMIQENGSLLLDGRLHEAATAAIANEDREMVIRAELRALGQLRRTVAPFEQAAEKQAAGEQQQATKERAYERRWLEAEARLRIAIAEGHKQVEIDALQAEVRNLRAKARGGAATIRAAIPPANAMKAAAVARIAATRVRDLKPAVFWSASRQAAQRAIDRAARQDFEGAIVAKQEELINLALYREATDVVEDIDKRVHMARDLARPKTLADLGDTYGDQIAGILDRFDFAQVPQRMLDRRASLARFVAGLEGEGIAVELPDEVLEEHVRRPYQELTVEELQGVTDALAHIAHLARTRNRLLKAAAKAELDETAARLAASIREHGKGPRREAARDRRPSEERRRTVDDWFAGHRKLASLLREMDGFQDGGPMWDAIMRPINAAGDLEAEMNAKATEAFHKIVDAAFPGSEKRTLYTKRFVAAVRRSMSRMERIMVAMNWGNDGNRDRIRRAEGWSDEQVQGILDTLTASDLRFVQDVFDLFETYKPAIGEKQKRITGIEPTWVEAVPFTAAAGAVRGGYFPLAYDDRLSAGAIKNLDLEAANIARQAAYAHATTKRGHTKERQTTVKMKVRLDFGVMFQHVDQVIHDLTHHEMLIDVGRLLGHRAVQDALLDVHGDLVYKQVRGSLRDIAFGDVPAKSGFERALNHVRAGATIAGLGWNITTAFLQPLGLANSWVRIGPKYLTRGIYRWLRSSESTGQTIEWITEKSAFMRARGRTQQREINEIRNRVNVSTGSFGGWMDAILEKATGDLVTRQGIGDSYFWMIMQMQRVADVPTWLGAYEKAMDQGEAEDKSIAMADQAVLDSQGGGQMKDLAQVQRGGPMMRLWTNFYSFFNVLYNQAAESKRKTKATDPFDVGRMASDYLMLFVVPAVLGYTLKELFRPNKAGNPGNDDGIAWSLLGEVASYAAGTMIGLREIAGTLQGYYGYEGPAGARFFAALARLGQQVRQGQPDAALRRAAIDVGGTLLHLPAAQVNRTLDGITALDEGKTDNPMAILTGAPR